MKQNRVLRKLFFFLTALLLFSCAYPAREKSVAINEAAPIVLSAVETQLPALPPQPDFLTIIAAGDNLYHDVMIKDGEEGDYESAYSELRPLVEKADIAFINQETLLSGGSYGFSGYPRFNSPQKLGKALASAGFDVVNHATNHIMDKGEKAVFTTLDFWKDFPEITLLGVHRSEEERNLPKLVCRNNITLGFLSYTYGTNGLPVPKDKTFLVSLIDTEIMAREIDALRPLCDFLVVSMHWGEEYKHAYNESQKKLAGFLAEHRVDLVFGHHPHVIQPAEYVARPDGKTMLCFYSLGNLISAQRANHTLLGALAYVKIQKKAPGPGEAGGNTSVTEAGAVPLVTHYGKNFTGFKVYPLHSYTDELAGEHYKNQTKKELTIDYLRSLSSEIFGDKEMLYNPFAP